MLSGLGADQLASSFESFFVRRAGFGSVEREVVHVAVGGRQVSRLVGQIQVSDLGVLTPYIVTERGDDGVAKIAELTEDLGARTRSSKPSAPRNR